ncbi:MAG: transposase [Cellulomonas sp.]|nr:transposase [Cellulomonas sp.]MCR6649166.1 transposase [Cellulomonas sp.]
MLLRRSRARSLAPGLRRQPGRSRQPTPGRGGGGSDPRRVRSEPAFARLCGVAPIPASSGTTTRHRLNRGGHRQANAALYLVVIVRMQHHEPTGSYVTRRMTEGKTKSEIIRCLRRHLAPALWAAMRPLRVVATGAAQAA